MLFVLPPVCPSYSKKYSGLSAPYVLVAFKAGLLALCTVKIRRIMLKFLIQPNRCELQNQSAFRHSVRKDSNRVLDSGPVREAGDSARRTPCDCHGRRLHHIPGTGPTFRSHCRGSRRPRTSAWADSNYPDRAGNSSDRCDPWHFEDWRNLRTA